jgi:penicillin-binding protein 1A|tara:strand:- start:4481 stop:6886 length:2406 start_codon:yes stop_codon:yes gene_type:complete
MNRISRLLLTPLLWLVAAILCGSSLVLSAAYLYLNPQIPPAETYRHVKLKTPLRVYSSDGKLMQEFGERLRPINFDDIPPMFVDALLDTEDKRFFRHEGIDLITLVNATYQLIANTGTIKTGASTITMQLARTLSLSREVKFIRKFKEMLLALKIESELSKQEILALYLNVIPFGKHAFGVQAASNVYYGKDVSELNLPQMAMLAGIPKAPESRNPINGPEHALERRNLVLKRMLEQESISGEQYQSAVQAPISASVHGRTIELPALYVGEMVRRELTAEYGDAVYSAGYEVFTTIDSRMQEAAELALQNSLNAYDQRHGYRKPERRRIQGTDQFLSAPEYGYPANWIKTLQNTPTIGDQHPAIVVEVEQQSIVVLNGDTEKIRIDWDGLRWARPYLTVDSTAPRPRAAADIVQVGDLVRLTRGDDDRWRLGQVPAIQGALVALDPNNGAIKALVGGYSFQSQQFNHATQARRQPGSNFKPFFYAGALESGLTAASIYNDAPLVLPGGALEETYRPRNSGDTFEGNLTLREALYRSINLISLRVLLDYGADNAIQYVKRFGFDTGNFPKDAQLALGGGTIALSPLDLATGYATFANGGFKVTPFLVDGIKSINGEVIFDEQPDSVCIDSCDGEDTPGKPAKRVVEKRVSHIINTMLRDVINKKRGTGRKLKRVLPRGDLHGKTGTTNDADIWFSGFNRQLVATAWTGFDNNGPVGNREYGNTAPLDMWASFMGTVLPEEEDQMAAQPPGLVSVRINPRSGLRARATDPDAVFEIFREELVPDLPADLHSEDEEDHATREIF